MPGSVGPEEEGGIRGGWRARRRRRSRSGRSTLRRSPGSASTATVSS